MKRIIFISLLLSFQIAAFGQDSSYTISLKPVFDPERKHQFGFGVGTGLSKMQVKWKDPNPGDENPILAIYSTHSLKLDILLIYQLNFSKVLAFRSTFGMFFHNATIVHKRLDRSAEIVFKTAPMVLATPVIIYIPLPSKKLKPYLEGDPSFLYNGTGRRHDPGLRLQEFDVLAELGVGVDVITPFFIVSPELKFSSGLVNVKPSANDALTNPIDKLSRQTISFGVTFRE